MYRRAMLEGLERELRKAASTGCFIRRSRADDALWVSDLPRRIADADALADIGRRFGALGAVCRPDQAARLWNIDLCAEGFVALAARLPRTPPPLPLRDELHPAYALCRLLLAHPAPIEEQPLEPLRAVLKRMDGADAPMLALIPALHGRCAELLRRGLPLPSAAGGALAEWIIAKGAAK